MHPNSCPHLLRPHLRFAMAGSGSLTVDEIKSLGDRNRNKFKAQN